MFLKKFLQYYRFYTEKYDDGSEKVLWTNLNIHHMKKVYKNLVLKEVLDGAVDVRMQYLCQLCVQQLRSECRNLGIDSTGLKVFLFKYI